MDKQKRQQGFLMIDALLAIVIISVALVAIIGMFIQSTKATQCSAEYTIASNLGQQQMELLKNTKKDVIKTKAVNDTAADIIIPPEFTVSPPSGFTVKSTAKQCPQNPTALAEVTVTVSWQDKKNSYRMPFTTFFPI